MPVYVYRCPNCGYEQALQRTMAERNEPVLCADSTGLLCDARTARYMERVLTAPAGIVSNPTGGSAGGKGR